MLLLDGISSWLKFKLILYNQERDWPEICKKGKRQSPIGICKDKARNVVIPPLEFLHYENPYKATVENNGHTVSIDIDTKEHCTVPTLRGGNLDGEFILHNIHFHWESEHRINDKRYPLEAHFVHYDKTCKTVEKALENPKGLIVMAVMFRTGNCYNPKLDNLISSTEKVAKKVKSPTPIKGDLIVDHLLPKDRCKFYMYEGSKTTPDCNENVRWIVFEELVPIGDDQLKRLSKIQTESGEVLNDNARPLQELNEREVLYTEDSGGKSITELIKEKLGVKG